MSATGDSFRKTYRLGCAVAERCLRMDPLQIGWDWGSGLLGQALTDWPVAEMRGPVAQWIADWCGHHICQRTGIHDRGGRMWKIGVGTSLLFLRDGFPELDTEERLQEFARYIEASPRLKGGVFASKEARPEVWVDTLMTLCPFLIRADAAGVFPGGRMLAEEQLRLHAAHLQDPDSGLWWHAANVETGGRMGTFWSRGNGWALFALAEACAESDAAAGLLRRTVEALLACQRPDGGWSTVLDVPDSFVETSGQAMIVHGLAKAARLGVLDGRSDDAWTAARRGAARLFEQITDDGEVRGTSIGTEALDAAYYAARPTASWPLWGPASVLLAFAELLKTQEDGHV